MCIAMMCDRPTNNMCVELPVQLGRRRTFCIPTPAPDGSAQHSVIGHALRRSLSSTQAICTNVA